MKNRIYNLIYTGVFNNVTMEELSKKCKEYYPMFQKTHPFNEDLSFLNDLQYVAAIKHHNQLSKEQKEVFTKLLGYFTHLQASMTYTSYHHFYPQFIQPRIRITDVVNQQELETLKLKFQELATQHDIAEVQHILGEGNCYYRAIIRTHIEQSILQTSTYNTAPFDLLIDKIQQIQNGSLKDHLNDIQKKSLQILQQKLKDVCQKKAWSTLQDFWNDLLKNNGELDKALIIACRYMVAQYLFENKDTFIPNNSLTYQELILSGYTHKEDFLDYLIHEILTDSVYAQGLFVELGILPALIGCKANIFFINSERKNPINIYNNDLLIQKSEIPLFTAVNIMLRAEHYEVLISKREKELRDKHNQRSSPLNITPQCPQLKNKNQHIVRFKEDAEILHPITIKIKDSVAQMRNTLIEIQSTGTNSPAISPLLDKLIAYSDTFLKDGNFQTYETNCNQSINQYKTVLSQEQEAPKTILQHIAEVFRTLFLAIDWFISKITGKKTMADTYNPLARATINRNHFLTKPEMTDTGKAIQNFAQALETLRQDKNPAFNYQ